MPQRFNILNTHDVHDYTSIESGAGEVSCPRIRKTQTGPGSLCVCVYSLWVKETARGLDLWSGKILPAACRATRPGVTTTELTPRTRPAERGQHDERACTASRERPSLSSRQGAMVNTYIKKTILERKKIIRSPYIHI